MKYPEFFYNLPTITLYDDLAQFLGVTEDGILEVTYIDIVKSEGHSCAVIAGAYLAALKGLEALYKEDIPRRGNIKVEIKKTPTEDNAGVIGCVLSHIMGVTTNYGFGGIPTGKYNRRNTLFFGSDINCDIRITRLDTENSVGINYRPEKVIDPMKILKSAIRPGAKPEDIKSFPKRFQEMVKTIFENANTIVEVLD
jgi:hypothetical protein